MKKGQKAAIYIFVVLAISAVMSAVIISGANDAFALCKSGEEKNIILAKDTSVNDVAKLLKKEGIIKYPLFFGIYCRLKSERSSFPSGEYALSSAMSYDEIRYELLGIGKKREEIRITIPEGYTTDEIIELFLSKGIGSRERFEEVINDYPFEYSFIALIPENPSRRYRLDGYLFPDTYMFYSDSAEETVIDRLLANFNKKFTSDMISDAAKSGYTIDEAVTLASMIQKEAYFLSDMAGISSVFRNRLKAGMKYLQSDATAFYGDAYDTYDNVGLPPGAIANPGYAALEAAVYPANTKYYYFVTGNNKKAVFSKTYAEHKRAIAKIKAEE